MKWSAIGSATMVTGTLLFALLTVNATLAPSAFCAGPEWIQIDENNESSYFYDKNDTSKEKEGKVQVRTRVVYTKEGKAEALKILSANKALAKLYESRYLHDVYCTDRESRLLEVTHLDKGGVTLKSTDLAAVTEREDIPPNARLALVADKICTR